MEYCEDILKSVDFSESDEEEVNEEERGILPPEAVQVLQSITLKRSLLETLNQAQETEPAPGKNPKWGPVLVQKPATRGHGNVNIMKKASAYKRKQNLEIPETFKGKSFSNTDHAILYDQISKVDLCIGGDEAQKNLVIDDLVVGEKERCLAFANNNPEIVLPDNLELDQNELVGTPIGGCSFKPVGTADALRRTPIVLTKVRPCGLSHPFKIA